MKRVAIFFVLIMMFGSWVGAAEYFFSSDGLARWETWAGLNGYGEWCRDGNCAKGFDTSANALIGRNTYCVAAGVGDYDTYIRLNNAGHSCYECGSDAFVTTERRFFCWNDPANSGNFLVEPEEDQELDTYWLGVFVYVALGCVLGLVFIASVYLGART